MKSNKKSNKKSGILRESSLLRDEPKPKIAVGIEEEQERGKRCKVPATLTLFTLTKKFIATRGILFI